MPACRRWVSACRGFLFSPNSRWSFAALVGAGLVLGVAGVGSVVGAMYYTSTNAFCSTCHATNAVVEWQRSQHYRNAVGFVAGCADCHEPHTLLGMLGRKIAAANETWNQMLGTINTPEKYEAHRLELAEKEWNRMRGNDSAECKTCHQPALMNDPDKAFLGDMHRTAIANGRSCIDCHKGVAHTAPTQKAVAAAPR
jgi:cytochrome c-type protein NapC